MPDMKYRKGSFCFNARSLARNGYAFPSIVEKFELEMNKHCTVSVDMFGNVRVSESLTCPPIGTVYTSLNELKDSIRNMKCHGCSHVNDLLPEYKRAIGL